jgi:hypothetical protein
MTLGSVVRKEFRHEDAVERVSKLAKIYKLLKMSIPSKASKSKPSIHTLFVTGSGNAPILTVWFRRLYCHCVCAVGPNGTP